MSNGIINITLADNSVPPSYLEFGLSTVIDQFPLIAQASPIFIGLSNGTYYVYFRKTGSPWNLTQVITKDVNCTSGISNVSSSRFVAVVSKINGDTQEFIDGLTPVPSLPVYQFIAHFFVNGREVFYVEYEKVNNNSIRLILDENVVFTGDIILIRI